MYLWMLVSMLGGCEQIAPSGNPLEPVVAGPASTEPGSEEPEPDSETTEESSEEVFSISSEDLLAIARGEDPSTPEPETAAAPEESPPPVAEAPSFPSAIEQPSAPPPPPPSAWGETLGKSWPVRLVTTVPNASPPRAILGLPDGREVVVNPGSMVPDMGLVVVAIAPNSAELARIAPAGDHATIETLTLQAQY
jgi:hypothetical protein